MRIIVAAAALAAASALAQAPSGKKFYEGIPPGLYRQVSVTEMKGMGLPKAEEKGTETKERCITQSELDRGVDMRTDCSVKKNEQSAAGAHIVMQCKDGSLNEYRLARTAGGYSSEIKSEGKSPDGKPFAMSMKMEGKYLGPCKG